MKSYLSLIPISAKVHRRQNRMSESTPQAEPDDPSVYYYCSVPCNSHFFNGADVDSFGSRGHAEKTRRLAYCSAEHSGKDGRSDPAKLWYLIFLLV